MKTYNGNYDEFTNYVMDIITIKKRRKIRLKWNKKGCYQMCWQDYLLQEVNKIKNEL